MQDGEPADEPKDTEQGIDVQTPPQPQPVQQRKGRRWWMIGLVVLLLVLVALAAWIVLRKSDDTRADNISASTSLSAEAKDTKLTLDPSKKYGNKYADGILPVGDGKYVTDGPKQGYVYACSNTLITLARSRVGR
jgi:hypothetical protein